MDTRIVQITETLKAVIWLNQPGASTTQAIVHAEAIAESAPFVKLNYDIQRDFDGDLEQALEEDEALATSAVVDILQRHLISAQTRLLLPQPRVDWSDRASLRRVARFAMLRQADLRFVQVVSALVADAQQELQNASA